ncbi:MAG: hypothetical protein J1E81_06010 [Eubacterium sp.]|nr:hypothetical protein [Eubacterium sp.]
MKAVLRSAKPYWIYLMLTGKKKIEVGKDFPKSADWDKTVELYCSNDKRSFNRIPEKDREWMRKYLGKVACRFICLKLEKFTVGSLRCDDIEELACLSYSEMLNYFYKPNELDGKTVKFGYAWHISDLQIYDTPKVLGEFKQKVKKCTNGVYYSVKKPLTRPPQSWQYVEVL